LRKREPKSAEPNGERVSEKKKVSRGKRVKSGTIQQSKMSDATGGKGISRGGSGQSFSKKRVRKKGKHKTCA